MRDAAIVAEALAEAMVTVDWAVVTTGTGEDTGGFRGEVLGGFSILVSSPIHSGVRHAQRTVGSSRHTKPAYL